MDFARVEQLETPEFEALESALETAWEAGTEVQLRYDQVPLLDRVIAHVAEDLLIADRDLRQLVIPPTGTSATGFSVKPPISFEQADVSGTLEHIGQTTLAAAQVSAGPVSVVRPGGNSRPARGVTAIPDLPAEEVPANLNPSVAPPMHGMAADQAADQPPAQSDAPADSVSAETQIAGQARRIGIRYGATLPILERQISVSGPDGEPLVSAAIRPSAANVQAAGPGLRMLTAAAAFSGLLSAGSVSDRTTVAKVIRRIRRRFRA